jgi:response regulator RpfG family c-di-GMP phosphodiesterase
MFLKQALGNQPYHLVFANNLHQAKTLIMQAPATYFSAYLLNDSLSDSRPSAEPCFEALELFKNLSKPESVPIILQTNLSPSNYKIQHGLATGAFFYLVKPYTKQQLISVLQTAVNGFGHLQEIKLRLADFNAAKTLLHTGEFQFKTPDEAKSLATSLALLTPNPKRCGVGLFELFINAIEHGNLGINYRDKTQLIKQNKLQQVIEERLQNPQHRDKVIRVVFTRLAKQLEFKVHDCGQGFDPSPFMDFSAERITDQHGRGILIARKLSFDSLHFEDGGRTAVARINL